MKHSGKSSQESVLCSSSQKNPRPRRCAKQFCKSYSRVIANFKKVGRPPKLGFFDIDEILRVRPYYSLRQLAKIFEVSRSCIQRVLKKYSRPDSSTQAERALGKSEVAGASPAQGSNSEVRVQWPEVIHPKSEIRHLSRPGGLIGRAADLYQGRNSYQKSKKSADSEFKSHPGLQIRGQMPEIRPLKSENRHLACPGLYNNYINPRNKGDKRWLA